MMLLERIKGVIVYFIYILGEGIIEGYGLLGIILEFVGYVEFDGFICLLCRGIGFIFSDRY